MADLADALAHALAPHGFVPATIEPGAVAVPVLDAWVRKTWNTNRGVVLLDLSEHGPAGLVVQREKLAIGRALGYVPFFYGIGLQVVVVGAEAEERELASFVDQVDNQRSIVQSLHVVDLARRERESARTWGQVFTGRFQDAIEAAIDGWLSR